MDKNNGESDKSLAPRSDAHMKLSDYIARRESVKLVREQQEDEKRQYRDLLHKQEKEFEQYREAFRSETLEREAKFQVEREAREARYVERERGLRARQSEIEILATQRQNELDALRVHHMSTFDDRSAAHTLGVPRQSGLGLQELLCLPRSYSCHTPCLGTVSPEDCHNRSMER